MKKFYLDILLCPIWFFAVIQNGVVGKVLILEVPSIWHSRSDVLLPGWALVTCALLRTCNICSHFTCREEKSQNFFSFQLHKGLCIEEENGEEERERDILLSCSSHGPVAGCTSMWAATHAKAPRAQCPCGDEHTCTYVTQTEFHSSALVAVTGQEAGPTGRIYFKKLLYDFGSFWQQCSL